MTVALAAVAAALLAHGLTRLTPDDGRAWRRARGVTRRALGVVSTRRLRGLTPACALLGTVVAATGAPMIGVLVGGTPPVVRAARRWRSDRRRASVTAAASAVTRAVADGLDAGFGVRRAITDAARSAQVDGPAGVELRSVAARLDAGDPLPLALDGWRRRTGEPAHATLVAGLLLHGEAGGELAEVLRDQAAALDRARRQAAEAESAIVQARAAARIVGGIPVLSALGAVLLAPDAVRQITGTALGSVLVLVAVGLQIAAAAAVRRLAAEPRGRP